MTPPDLPVYDPQHDAPAPPTQVRHPFRSTVRTVFQIVVGFAPLAPVIYEAATNHDPALASGLAGTGLAVSAGIARVMALAPVEAFLGKWAPWLAATPESTNAETR